MNQHAQEDSFPTAKSRGYRDSLDLGLAILAQKAAVGVTFPVAPPKRANTHYVQFHTSGFAEFCSFEAAREFYRDHINDFHPPRVLGAFYDEERDGLTEDESLAVQEVEQLRKPGRRSR